MLPRFIKEAAYLVAHADFLGGNFPERDELPEQARPGYALAPASVHPNIFGCGPGRFGTAFKLFRFAVRKDGDARVEMVFLSAPPERRSFISGDSIPSTHWFMYSTS